MTAAPSNTPSREGDGEEHRPSSPDPPAQQTDYHTGSGVGRQAWAGDAPASPALAAHPPSEGTGPVQGGPKQPAPPPPPAWGIAAAVIEGKSESANARVPRRHVRLYLGGAPPARITMATSQPVFVTLNDISPGGCCIVRKGRLELSTGDAVIVDVWADDIQNKLSLRAKVCWTKDQEDSTRVGLRFIETNHRLLRQIETYMQQVQQPVDESRPRPKVPDRAPISAPEPVQPQPRRPRQAQAPGRPRRANRSGTGSPERRDLSSMPRPGPLTSLEVQRRMRPAHRHEVARIAEETGIHIQTLYGWLQTLRLEGEVSPKRPRDPEAWSATDKFSALLQVTGMSAAERSAYCNRHGLSEEQLQHWRQAALQANEKPLLILRAEEELQRLLVRDQRDIRRLQKELRRRERSASIGEELLQVVRKLQTLWEQGDLQ